MVKEGAYSDNDIREFINNGIIASVEKVEDKQIQPSSFDARLKHNGTMWCMPFSSIPKGDLVTFLDENSLYKLRLSRKRHIHKRIVYVFELAESLNLPPYIFAKSNPKSTTGREDIHVRLLTEGGEEFDEIPPGYKGKLFLEVFSHSFDLLVEPGHTFNQIRFLSQGAKELDQGTLNYLARSEKLLYSRFDGLLKPIEPDFYIKNGAANLTLDLDPKDPGFKAREDAPPLDLSAKDGSLPLSNYFEKVNLIGNNLIIAPGSFYILKSNEVVKIPIDHCAELADITTKLGEFRAHYAGFFDPNFNSVTTLEIRNTGISPYLLKKGQTISSLWFYALVGKPSVLYGDKRIETHYQYHHNVVAGKRFYNNIIEQENEDNSQKNSGIKSEI